MSIERNQFRCLEPLRVRWAEVDPQQIVFNGHYLTYFDTAVAGWWRDLALPYHDAMSLLEGELFVRKATVEYEASARWDDVLRIGVKTERIGNSSLVLRCAVFKATKRLVHGELVYVFADPRTQTSRPVPLPLRELLQHYEAGDAMTSARVGDWASLSPQVTQLRQTLPTFDADALAPGIAACPDGGATHVLLMNRLAQAVAAARIWPRHGERVSIDGIAVHPALRGSGLTRTLLRTAREAACNEGAQVVSAEAPPGLAAVFEHEGFEIERRQPGAAWTFVRPA